MKNKVLNITILKKYRDHLVGEERSKATIDKYIRDINGFYEFLPEDKIITKEMVISYKQTLTEKYKTASVNSMLVAINGLLVFLGMGNCKVKLHKLQKRIFNDDSQNLTKEEYRRLLKAAQLNNNEQLLILMQTICATGIRVSEHKFITIEALKNGKAIICNKGKIREIIFPKKLKRALLDFCKKRGIKSGAVFVTKNGNPLDRSNIWTMMKNLCEKANVDKSKVFPHNLRHLFAFSYYKIEKDLVRLADILGHSSIETTRIYTKTSIKKCQSVLNRMDLFSNEFHPMTA